MSVDLDPQVKRSPEKLAKELRDLNDVIQDKVGLKEFDVIVSFFVGNVDYLDILTLDDGVAPDLTQLLSQSKVSNDQVDDLLRKVSETGGAKKFQALLRMVQLARDREYEKLVAVSREIFGKNVSGAPLRVLYSVISNLKDYEYLAEVLSANNIFEPDVLHNFLMSKPSRPEMAGVAQNYLKHQNRKAAVEYLKEASRISNDPEISLLASQVLIETGDVTSAGQLLSNIRFEDLQKEDDFDKLITGLITCEDYKHALRISNYASQQFKKSPRFVTRKAMCLKSLGRGDDALEVLDSWHQKKDTEIAKEKAAILYDLKRFQEYADLIHTMNPDGVSDPVERERYLSALLEGSRFNEALQEIGKSLAKVPNDPGVLQQKFKLQTMLNDISGAYETAERILAVDKANRECSAFVLDYLFGNGEYEKFIERFGSLSKNSGYSKGPLVAALIFSAQVDDAIERIRSDHSYLKQPEVIDALFFTLREEEQVDTVLEICENDGFDLAAIAMSRIKGKKMQFSSTIWDQIKTTRSEAVIWSVAMETINFRDRTRPEMVSALLSDKKFANLSNLSEAIVLVYAGKYYEEMTDNRKFMYPLTEALVENGRTRDAEVKLEQSHDPKRLDPFYHYLLSRIQYLEGDISASRKSILRALGRLSNRNFFLQSIRISISQDDPDSILSALDGIAKMDALESCDLSELFAYVSKDGEENLAKEILHRFGDQDVKNIWINRLQRDQYLRSNEFEEAARISRKIVLNSSKVADDVRKHAILLENTAKEEERVDYLMQEEKTTGDPQIEIWLGDYYYIKKNYEKALETYEKAIQKGTREGEIKNLPETLIELGEFERVEKMLSGSPGNEIALIKLYHRTGRIPEITNLLRNVKVDNKEDEAVIQYISRILWVNRQVRDTLIEMFHSTGSLFLGKIISQHMVESRDFINAERVMRAILKLYPEDAQNIRALSDLLVENNHPSEAAAILLRSVKQFSGAEQREIADRLMRIYFEITEYRALLDFFWKNTWVLDQTNIQWVIRSLIENGDFDSADQLAGQYHGNLLGEENFREIIEEINLRKEFLEVLSYASDVLKTEYKYGKIMTSEEMVYYAGIPVDVVARVIQLLGNEEYYRPMDERIYESVSREVIQRAVRKSTVETIRDMKMYVIFNNLAKKDVILAKNIYIYIQKSVEKKRDPLLNDPTANAFLKSAIKLGLRPEPLDVAYNLNLGISDAMDIIALMEYMAKLNS